MRAAALIHYPLPPHLLCEGVTALLAYVHQVEAGGPQVGQGSDGLWAQGQGGTALETAEPSRKKRLNESVLKRMAQAEAE